MKFAKVQEHEPISLICSLYKEINNKQNEDALGQFSIFNIKVEEAPKQYDRMVISLCQTPKKNPHHLLVQRILNEGEKLTNSGYLYVFSNQKLFVPSHSERVEGLLKKMKIAARLNFENLSGRGEVPKYLYVFSKKVISSNWNKNIDSSSMTKESCLSFNFTGQLSRFSKFDLHREVFSRFIEDNDTINTPLYQNEPQEGLSFEFHQDAIIGGKLLSHSSDTNNITHPNYFKKLTKSCTTFDQFFIIDHINRDDERSRSSLLGFEANERERFPFLLIIDFSEEENIKLEITSFDLYKSKADRNGHAYFMYFGLTPKTTDLSINLFRDFFNTDVGRQIIQLTFNGSFKKAKSKLSAMLIPKFFLNTKHVSDNISFKYSFFNKQIDEVRIVPSKELEDSTNKLLQEISSDQEVYPWHISCLVSHFKITCQNYLHDLENNSSVDALDYTSQDIIGHLMSLEKKPIYNDNKDIYIEPFLSNKAELELPLTSTKLTRNDEGNILSLYHNDKLLMNFRAEYELLHFINFILNNSIGNNISNVIHGLRVPSYVELKEIVDLYIEGQKNVRNVIDLCTQRVNNIIIQQIFNT